MTNICHSINTWQERQRIFEWNKGENEYEKILKEAEEHARKLRIRLRKPSISAHDVSLCDENPLRNLYISADGEVSPCVYLYPPLASPFKRIFCNKEYWMEKVSFGNIFKEPFPTIWNSEGYVRFRNCFVQRESKFKELYFSVWNIGRKMDLKDIVLPEPPEPCKTCHKILGV